MPRFSFVNECDAQYDWDGANTHMVAAVHHYLKASHRTTGPLILVFEGIGPYPIPPPGEGGGLRN